MSNKERKTRPQKNRQKRISGIDMKVVLKTLGKKPVDLAETIDFTPEGVRSSMSRGKLIMEKAILFYALELAGFDVLGLIRSKFDTSQWFKKL